MIKWLGIITVILALLLLAGYLALRYFVVEMRF